MEAFSPHLSLYGPRGFHAGYRGHPTRGGWFVSSVSGFAATTDRRVLPFFEHSGRSLNGVCQHHRPLAGLRRTGRGSRMLLAGRVAGSHRLRTTKWQGSSIPLVHGSCGNVLGSAVSVPNENH